ncbi:class I adenylate-forming enzyme family protein [Streptomyces sp. DH12]|uniref:class I adenylate-forming enzyme family protein n=1 Tax=Streptomyces sp. DH12 TaxID=2857010 RepID=UPI001E335787|nr:AMP-binding protein [Streptomyces sp. DH12]
MTRLRPWPTLLASAGTARTPARVNAAAALLAHAHGATAHQRCLVTDDETWTYGELRHRSRLIASVLTEDLGLVTGARVLLRGPNSPWYAACWLGTLLAGGVVVSGHEQMTAAELADVVEVAGVTHALGPAAHLDPLIAVAPHLATSAHPTGLAQGGADLPARCARRSPAAYAADTAADDVALIIFTSGTTGRPKAVAHFHRDVVTVAATMGEYVTGLAPGDLVTTTASLSFVAALGVAVQGVLATGAAALMQPSGGPEAFFDAAERHRATVVMASPGYYRWALQHPPRPMAHAPRRYLVGGEPLPRITEEGWLARTGLRLTNILGTTELFSAFVATRPDVHRPGSVGRVVPGYRLRVLGPDGSPLPPGEPGRLAVCGPTGVRYLDAPACQAAALHDGWTLTGDLCSLGPEGDLWHHSRQDDMVIIEGMNVYPVEVEEALLHHPAVRQAAVVGVQADNGDTELHAYLVLDSRGDTGSLLAEVRAAVERRLTPFKVPRRYVVRDALPLTHTGKVNRSRLIP